MKRRPEPAFAPATMQLLTLVAAAGCALGLSVGLVLALVSDSQPVWYSVTWLVVLAAAGGWNLRTYLQLRSGAHWSQQADGPEGGHDTRP